MTIFGSLKSEAWYPAVIASVTALTFYFSECVFPKGESVLSAGLTMGAIFTAFIATNKSVILTLDTRIMKRLRESKYFSHLMGYLKSALWSSFCFSILCLSLFFIEVTDFRWMCSVWIFNAVHMILTFFRVTTVLLAMIEDKAKTEK